MAMARERSDMVVVAMARGGAAGMGEGIRKGGIGA